MPPFDAPQRNAPHALSTVAGLAPELVSALRAHWIETAEEALALVAAPGGLDGLRRLVLLDAPRLEEFVQRLADVIGAERVRAIQSGAATPGVLGALLTTDQKRRFGIEDDGPSSGGEST